MSHDRRDDTAVSAWLRALATRAESDPTFAAQILAALRESGLMAALSADGASASPRDTPTRRPRTRSAPRGPTALASETPPFDPFSVYRSQGEAGLRAALDALDLAALRLIVRERRLDPARISARWTTRERVISLIVDQVRARANHGHAFERV